MCCLFILRFRGIARTQQIPGHSMDTLHLWDLLWWKCRSQLGGLRGMLCQNGNFWASKVSSEAILGHTITLNQEYFEHACINCISASKYYYLLYILIINIASQVAVGFTHTLVIYIHTCTSSSDKEPFFSSTLAANLFTIPTISLAWWQWTQAVIQGVKVCAITDSTESLSY